MKKSMFYSVASFVISASLWVAEFFVSLAVPGRQFRFLTIWGLTAGMCMHAYQLFRMRRSPLKKASALFTMAAAMNLVILLMYWTAYFVFPHMIAVEGYHVLHDIFIHAICPLLCIIDTAFLSNALQDIKLSATYLQASICMYVLWLELFVAPFSILPYAFLRGVTLSARLVCYAGIALFSHFSHLLLHVFFAKTSKQTTCPDQVAGVSISSGLKSGEGPAIQARLQPRPTASQLLASQIMTCHEKTSIPEAIGNALNASQLVDDSHVVQPPACKANDASPITATVLSAGASEDARTCQNGVRVQPRYGGDGRYAASSPSPSDASDASTALFASPSLLAPSPEGHGVSRSSPTIDASTERFSPPSVLV